MIFPVDRFQTIETPFYYYDMALLDETLRAVKAEGPDSNFCVHYAVKANTNPVIMEQISRAGLGADCVSGGEILAAIAAGFRPDRIMFAGVGKSDKEINIALDAGIQCFNVESLAELEVIDTLAGVRGVCAPVALRVNPNVGAHTHTYITTGRQEDKFGIDIRDIDSALERVACLQHVRLMGLHFHIGSQILEMSDYIKLCERINPFIENLEARGIMIENINVGGGLGVDYVHPDAHLIPDFKAYFATFRNHLLLRPGQTLHFEIGRAVVAQCGSLISRVLYVKQGRTKQFVILDAGMNDLVRPAMYGAYHRIDNLTSPFADKQTYDVVGPVCESSDVFARDVMLRRTMRGDLVAIRTAGAYGQTMSSQYNARPLAQSVISSDLV